MLSWEGEDLRHAFEIQMSQGLDKFTKEMEDTVALPRGTHFAMGGAQRSEKCPSET